MKNRLVALLGIALCSASPASAQLPVTFGISAGATIPVGDFGDLNDAGYNLGATAATTRYDDVTSFGLNGGAGLSMPLAGFSAFAEARVHWVSTGDELLTGSAAYIPLVFGITF